MKSFNLYEDEQLIREIKADNRSAFDILYRKYCKDLYGFTISILKSREESENLIQDVFVSLWMNRYNVKIDSSIKSYRKSASTSEGGLCTA